MKRKTRKRIEAAHKEILPAAEDVVHAAADKVRPIVHQAVDRVGPLAQAAADRVGPLAHAAADRVGDAADKVSPFAHAAAEKVGPLASAAADRVGPFAQSAVDRVSPYAHAAVDKVAPLAQHTVGKVTPYAHQAAGYVSPIAHSAKQRGARIAHDAVDKVQDDFLPKLSEALSAAAGMPLVVEAAKRGKATVAAAKGDLVLPEEKRKGRWLKRLAVVALIAGVAAFVARKFLSSQDADWQAAAPSAPLSPHPPSGPPPASATDAEPDEDPQGGETAHIDYIEANPGAPGAEAEGVGDVTQEDRQGVDQPPSDGDSEGEQK